MDRLTASLCLFGHFKFLVDGKQRHFATRKAESLLAYLVLASPKAVSREKVLGALWPETDEDRARKILSTTLWRVQKGLSGSAVSIRSEHGLLLLDNSGLEVDVTRFKQMSETSVTDQDLRVTEIERAVTIYGGELLEGVDEEWCELERGRLRTTFLSMLKELVAAYRDRATYQRAIEAARRVVELDPMDEDTHRDLMLLFHLEGDRSAALAQYQTINNLLQAELGISPESRTTDLWRYIRSGSPDISGGRANTFSTTWAIVEHAATHPILGRDEELTKILQGLTEALHGRGSVFFVSGDAGIGKTKLVDSVEVEARLRGFEVLKGRCTELCDPAPYQAFIEAVWPRISREMQGDTPQVLHDFLAHLSPALRRRKSQHHTADAETAVANEALLALLDGEAPVLLVLEDFQHSDHATRTLIDLLAGRLGSRRIMVLLPTRTPLNRRDLNVGASALRNAAEIRLGPLNHSDTDELIKLSLGSRTISSSVLSSIWDRTVGNPFAVIEYVSFLTERGYLIRVGQSYWTWAPPVTTPPQLPRRVQVLLRERINALRGEARTLLQVAAVLGYEADLTFLEKLSGLEANRFADVVNHLFKHGILVENARGYRFAHESYRLASLSTITGASRRLLHRRTAILMEELWPARSEDLSWHFLEAGDRNKATKYAELSGDKARAVHANENALKWYSKALELCPVLPDGRSEREPRILLLFKRQEVLGLLGHSRQQLDDLDEIIDHANSQGELGLLARCQCLKAHSLSRMNRNSEGLEAVTLARRLYRSLADTWGEAHAYEVSAQIHIHLRDARRVKKAYGKALELFRAAGDAQGSARAVLGMGTLMLFTGRNQQGLSQLQRAEATLAKSSDKRDYAPALLQKGVFCRCLGQAEKSEKLLIQGIELMREHGDRVGEARGLSQLAYTHMTLGMLRKALHEARRSIKLAAEVGDTRGQIVFRNNAAYAVYRCLGDFGRAQRCVCEAISLVRTTGREENQATYYDTMAAILYDKGEFKAAYHWAHLSRRLYRRWSGQFDFVGAEIEFRLGAAALALGRTSEARECLNKAVSHWQRSHDRALLARGIVLLGRVALVEGRIAEAVGLADRSARLLRQRKGVEGVQHVYSIQAEIYRAAGLTRHAERALDRAYATVAQQSDLLKGRLRRSFLAIPSNRRIVEEHGSAGSINGEHSVVVDTNSILRAHPLVATVAWEVTDPIERRERLIQLMRKGDIRRRVLAELLGVSERTVRNDIAALRALGMLPQNLESVTPT